MADVKISALAAATTPLAGTEVVPVVQSATTKNVAVSDLTAGRVVSANGIAFPASQSASSNVNTLDDYEEGTWTPALSAASAFTSITYNTVRGGKYTKIGNMVYCQFTIRTDSISGGSGKVTLTGLPFTSAAASVFNAGGGVIQEAGSVGAFAGDVPSAIKIENNTATAAITYRATANGNTADLDVTDLNTGAATNFMNGTFSYMV